MVTRIAKLKGYSGGVIGGQDLANVLKEGHVYQLTDLIGQIIITDLGEYDHALHDNMKSFPEIMMDGSYLIPKK